MSTPAGATPDPEKRNFLVNVVEGGLFMAGSTFISVQTVLPAMVLDLGGGNVAVGALGVLSWSGLFLPQLFAARHFETSPWKKPWAIRLGLVQRIIVGLIAAVLFVYGLEEPAVALGLFLILYALMHIVLGLTVPAWFDLVGKVTAITRRGRLAGYRSALAGILGFGCSLVLAWILIRFDPPLKYALVFFSAFLFQMASLWVQSGLVELEPSAVSARRPLGEFLREIRLVLHANRSFRNFIISTVFLVLASISITFFPVYAIQKFGAGGSIVGEFTMVMVASQIISAPAMGYLSDHWGNKLTLIAAASALLVAALWAVISPSLGLFHLVFAFLGINMGTEIMARYNIAVEFALDQKRALHLGLMNVLLAPCYGVGLLGGLLSNAIGYEAVFIAGAACSVTGIVLMICSVKEPRRGR